MLPNGLTYPIMWPATYIAKDRNKYACVVLAVHHDVVPYYTVDVLEGAYTGERQTVNERLASWVDKLGFFEIQREFEKYSKSMAPKYNTCEEAMRRDAKHC